MLAKKRTSVSNGLCQDAAGVQTTKEKGRCAHMICYWCVLPLKAGLHLDLGKFLCFLWNVAQEKWWRIGMIVPVNIIGWLCLFSFAHSTERQDMGKTCCRSVAWHPAEAPAVSAVTWVRLARPILCFFFNLFLRLTSTDLTDKLEWLILEKTLHVTLQDRVSKKILNSYSLLVVYPLERSFFFWQTRVSMFVVEAEPVSQEHGGTKS